MCQEPNQMLTKSEILFGVICLTAALSVVGCGGEGPAPEPESAPQPEASPEEVENATPKVFFVEPADGATVQSPVAFMFGAENFVIEPVGDGEIHGGAGHHHLGVDTECLPAGEIVPQGDPWIHFGDASTEIEMQLEPGDHSFCMQAGDAEHRTLAGLSAVINITVE